MLRSIAPRRRPGPSLAARGAVFSMGFGALWLLSAALFWNSAQEGTAEGR